MKKDNPFSLTFGKLPGKTIERVGQKQQILDMFTSEMSCANTCLITGIRGSGKTVLMTSVARELADEHSFIVLDLNSSAEDLLEEMAFRLEDVGRKKAIISEGGIDVSVAGFGLGVSASMAGRDSVSRIEAVLEKVSKKHRRVLITLDEVVPGKAMRRFANQFQIMLRKGYPVFLVMTGLYDNIFSIQNDRQLTFLLRSPLVMLEPLSSYQIVCQYEEIFGIDTGTAATYAALVCGYAFAFQAFGYLLWEYGDEMPLDDILKKFDSMLDAYAYRKIWEDLGPVERKVASLLSSNGTMDIIDIRSALDYTPGNFSRYRDNLIRKGVAFAPAHGKLELALPRFGNVVKGYVAYDSACERVRSYGC